jgi:hypothetical protein
MALTDGESDQGAAGIARRERGAVEGNVTAARAEKVTRWSSVPKRRWNGPLRRRVNFWERQQTTACKCVTLPSSPVELSSDSPRVIPRFGPHSLVDRHAHAQGPLEEVQGGPRLRRSATDIARIQFRNSPLPPSTSRTGNGQTDRPRRRRGGSRRTCGALAFRPYKCITDSTGRDGNQSNVHPMSIEQKTLFYNYVRADARSAGQR